MKFIKLTEKEYKELDKLATLMLEPDENFDELSLTGKLPESFTIDEVIRISKIIKY